MNTFNPLTDLPMGLGATLGQNRRAMEYFSALSPDEQRQVIDGAQGLRSGEELRAYVDRLIADHPTPF